MADLGDLTNFMREGSVANLDWLDVDEAQYRELDRLPKQNLDVVPDLEYLWSHSDLPQGITPNKEGGPRTMLDVGKGVSEDVLRQVIKVARLALMQSTDPGSFRHALVSRFDSQILRDARPILAQVLQERGLLGRYYVDAIDFPNCHRAGKEIANFAKRYTSSAQFLVAKDSCAGCIHSSGVSCAVFQKKLVPEVLYTPDLADSVERSQAAQGKLIQASSSAPRDRIRAAHLASNVRVSDRVETPKPVVNPAQFMQATDEPPKVHTSAMASQAQALHDSQMAWDPKVVEGRTAASISRNAIDKKAFDIVTFLQREMLKGHGEQALLQSLKLSFSLDDLRTTRHAWEPIFKEAGYFGTIYANQESFHDCHEGADFLAKFNPSVKGIVAGGKCSSCIYSKMSRCMIYGKRLVAKASDLYTPEMVSTVVQEHRLAGRLGTGAETAKWGVTPVESLKAVYRTASKAVQTSPVPMRSYIEQAFRGTEHGHVTAGLTKREIVKTAKRYLNEGLYGEQLIQALQSRFGARDVQASADELKVALVEQGLQGIFFIDPTVYEDYAKGCEEGARLHRSHLVPYLKMGPKCSSCVLQPQSGFCSKYAKALVLEPPYADKAAQQQEILASGKSTEINLASLMVNDKSIVAEFALKSATDIELNPEITREPPILVELGGSQIELT
jgi:hypothetical protein